MALPLSGQAEELPTLRVRGKTRSYFERRRIGRREFFLLEQVGGPLRRSALAFDPRSGPGGEFVLVQSWVPGPHTEQRLRVLRRLKADCFPRCLEWQRRSGRIDVALTWVEGIPLNQYFERIRQQRRPPVSPREAVRLIHGLAHGICRLHQSEQLSHGDIQPANVILTNHPSQLRLIDFGSAWTVETTARRLEGDGAQPCYMAPELVDGSRSVSGFLVDQFSVSLLFYELLTQQLPYGGLGGKFARMNHGLEASTELQRPSQLSANCRSLPRLLRDGIDRIACRGLALSPDERYPNRHAWLDELSELSARFRLPPELPPLQRILTGVVGLFSGSRGIKRP